MSETRIQRIHLSFLFIKDLRSVVPNSEAHGLQPPGSSVHEIHQARALEWGAMSFSRGSFLTQGSNPHLCTGRQILYH